MEESKLLKRINYYDIKGKRMLQTSGKLYATDIGILNANTSFNNEMNIGFKLENVVLLELLANDYEVYTFKTRNGKEIDFLAIKNEKKIYFQICKDFSSNEVFKREFENLESIRDSNRKIVLSMNKKDFVNDKGIEHKYLINWLLEKEK
jgi:predicted AAA+ superfamily ATPase